MAETTTGALTEEQVLLLDTIRKFSQEAVAPGASERDLEHTFPEEVFSGIAELGLLGVPYPESVGGVEMGHLTHVLVLEELAAVCASTAMTVLAHTNLALGAVVHGGSPMQHETFGASLAAGEPLGALALGAGEVMAGPASGGVTAVKAGDGYVLNGTVEQVMNGGRAGILVVLAGTDSDPAKAGLFIVEGDAAGLERGAPVDTLGLRAMDIAPLTFKDVNVPGENCLGDPAGGFEVVRKVLDHARVAMAAVQVGLARGALDGAVHFGKERIAFGKPIAAFDGSLEKYSTMVSALESIRQLTYAAARVQDEDGDFTNLAAMAQIQAGRVSLDVGYESLQILGGYGYCHEYVLERICRDAKMCEVGVDEMAFVRRDLARRFVGL